MNLRKTVAAVVLLCCGSLLLANEKCRDTAKPVVPLLHASLHRDADRARPLVGALELGFCSVETDVHLVDGALLLGHDRKSLQPDRTLKALYFEPLRQRAKNNGGRLYRNGPTFTLLLDFKTDGCKTYAAVRKLLEEYADIVTVVKNGKVTEGAVTVVVSGNATTDEAARKAILTDMANSPQYASMDGRLSSDLSSDLPSSTISLISDNWGRHFKWRGQGPMPAEEKAKLRDMVKKAHEKGYRVRFWATPEKPEFWNELLVAGVDLINTDRPEALQKFLLGRQH